MLLKTIDMEVYRKYTQRVTLIIQGEHEAWMS